MHDRRPSLEQLERALAINAYLVVRYGERYAHTLERLEREVENARRNGAVARARRILEYYKDGATAPKALLTKGDPRRIRSSSAP